MLHLGGVLRNLLNQLILDIFTIEKSSSLLQRVVTGLDKQEVNNDELDSQPDIIHNVVYEELVNQSIN